MQLIPIIIFFIILFIIIIVLFKLYQILTLGYCTSPNRMNGKVVIISGANAGIGFETAKDLATRGARVILACRNEIKGRKAQEIIKQETGNNEVVYKQLNLSSLQSVKDFVDDIYVTENHLDVLINNAGVVRQNNHHTKDGIIEDMQINYFAHYLLTLLLLPLLKQSQPSRIINVTSCLHIFGVIDFNKINLSNYYNYFRVYCNSKLCNVLFTVELAKRLEGSGVVVNCVHPGVVKTTIVKSLSFIMSKLVTFYFYLFFKTPYEGAQTTIHVAVSDECKSINGKYFSDCKECRMTCKARDSKLTAKLWEYSANLVKLNNYEK